MQAVDEPYQEPQGHGGQEEGEITVRPRSFWVKPMARAMAISTAASRVL
ncbi:MAG: hypothetical protein ACUVRX_07140 [Actinomycetota bacterium]